MSAGTVIAIDVTPEMLSQACPASREARAVRLLADARSVPLADGSADAVFAAGLISHLPDTEAGRRWPPGTVGRWRRTTRSRPIRSSGPPGPPAGGWRTTTTRPIASSPPR